MGKKIIRNEVLIFFCLLFILILYCSHASFTPPTLKEKAFLKYPPIAQEKMFSGNVQLHLVVTDEGNVNSVKIYKSSGYGILDSAATEYCKKLKFNPARNKDGKPITSMISWNVQFKYSKENVFANSYVKKVKTFYSYSDPPFVQKNDITCRQILEAHQDFALNMTDNIYHNRYIKKVLKPEVYSYWEDIWGNWPLRFVVFHDFILRYPNCKELSIALSSLQKFVTEDISYIKEIPNSNSEIKEKKNLALKKIFNFLKNEYPQLMTEDLQSDADYYIKK